MLTMSLSSLCFGILLILRAALAQSAPHIYPDIDEDEEAVIDRLATLVAVSEPEILNRQMFSDFELPQLGYLSGINSDALVKASLENMPRQFGYRPDDLRFFLPASHFVDYFPASARDKSEVTQDIEDSGEDARTREQMASRRHEPEIHFMKKNEPEPATIQSIGRNSIVNPSNILASEHSVDKPMLKIHSLGNESSYTYTDIYYIAIIAGCSAAAVVGVIAAGICWYRIHERVKAAADVDYPAYGVTGPSKDVSPSGGDRKLAQSAHMYHYQHQKQQMAALQKGSLQGDRQGSGGSDVESDDDNEEGDYTVYECPGLAPAGEMEVKNPLFQDEPTPATPQQTKPSEDSCN